MSILFTSCSMDTVNGQMDKVKSKMKNLGVNKCYDKNTNTVKHGCKK